MGCTERPNKKENEMAAKMTKYEQYENTVVATENGLYKGTLVCNDASDASAAIDLLATTDDEDLVASNLGAYWEY